MPVLRSVSLAIEQYIENNSILISEKAVFYQSYKQKSEITLVLWRFSRQFFYFQVVSTQLCCVLNTIQDNEILFFIWLPIKLFLENKRFQLKTGFLLCQVKGDQIFLPSSLKGSGYFFAGHKTQCPQIYIKLTQFEDSDDIKLPLKCYLQRCCSFREMSKRSNTSCFST